ncbi:MAG: carbohydrate kinase family protein [Bryobacteraceae bacterium]|nr:carbohydrate kinase family protein [Bryobacteraceae bacterium]
MPADLVTVAGEIYLDQILSGFDAWPSPGEEAFARSYFLEAGGGAAHTAAGLSRLGREVRLICPVGAGDFIPHRLRQLGIAHLDLRCFAAEPTGTTLAVSTPQDRTFFTYRGANRFLHQILSGLDGGGHLHLPCTPSPLLIRELRGRYRSLSLDAGFVAEWLLDPAVHRALALLDWFLPNQREAALLTGTSQPEAMLRALAQKGIRAAIKLGSHGSAMLVEGDMLLESSIPVQPVDTTGAGDCFDAGFLDAWLRGEPPSRCLKAGNVCGALSTRAAGGIAAFPTPEELSQWL